MGNHIILLNSLNYLLIKQLHHSKFSKQIQCYHIIHGNLFLVLYNVQT